MIPNVSMRWCGAPARCQECPDSIGEGEPVVVVFFWNKGSDNRKWNRKFYYHPQCWVNQGLDYLRRNPYIHKKRGPKVTLSEEDRRQRYLLVRRFHALEQRKQKIKADYPDRLLIESRLDEQMLGLVIQMANYGGAPTTWLTKII